jgi:poly(3-hydroxybutyrate) depolymerase
MNSRARPWPYLFALAIGCVLLTARGSAETLSESAEINGMQIAFKVVLPDSYDPTAAYRAILAFPGGGQTMRNVDRMLEQNWRDEAERLNFIVVSPAAPEAGLYFQGGAAAFPAFLDYLAGRFNIAARKFHIAGISNGGASAFHIAATYPEYFWSVTGLPGYLPYLTAEKLEALAPLCIYMHVGERDDDWVETMLWQAQQFTEAGARVSLWVEPDQDHVMRSLTGSGAARLFAHFDDAEAGCGR